MYFHPKITDPELISRLTTEQLLLQQQIRACPLPSSITTIAGCDCALTESSIFSVFVVFAYPSLKELEIVTDTSPLTLPYVPGFLAFREIPGLLQAFSKLNHRPNIIMVDGQGILHPRRIGIATHLGIKLNIPTIGVAKKKLCGTFDPPEKVGEASPVIHHNETVGYAYLSKPRTNPIFISPGHMCDLPSALACTKSVFRSHKLPEPTRIADAYSKKLKNQL